MQLRVFLIENGRRIHCSISKGKEVNSTSVRSGFAEPIDKATRAGASLQTFGETRPADYKEKIMSYIKIGSAYFDKDKIKAYHLRQKKDAEGEIYWEVRADTTTLYRCREYLKAHQYLHEVIDTVNKAE